MQSDLSYPHPEQIPHGTKVVSVELADGNIAVKVAMKSEGKQLYGTHTKSGRYLHELLTLEQVKSRLTKRGD